MKSNTIFLLVIVLIGAVGLLLFKMFVEKAEYDRSNVTIQRNIHLEPHLDTEWLSNLRSRATGTLYLTDTDFYQME